MVTDTQRAYLRAVQDTGAGKGTTQRAVAEVVGAKPSRAQQALGALARKGLVTSEPRRHGTTRLTDAGRAELAGLAVVDVVRITRGTLAQIEAEWAERRDAR